MNQTQPNRYTARLARRDIRARQPDPPRLEIAVTGVVLGAVLLAAVVGMEQASRGV